MDKRIRLGYVCSVKKGWLGGYYYTLNLLHALNTLDDNKKPIVDVNCLDDETFENIRKGTNYPYLEKTIIKQSFWKRVFRRLIRFVSMKCSCYIDVWGVNQNNDIIFPWIYGSKKKKLIYWKPDFQEKHFPQYFTSEDLRLRDRHIDEVCKRCVPIVFSSQDSRNDFDTFFPQYKQVPTYVVRFASYLPDFSDVDIDDLKQKYGIRTQYLFCANQFWQHKNHLFLFKAFYRALKKGLNLQLICTGSMSDYRVPMYIDEIRSFLESNNLKHEILTLGVIDKKELLCLMKNSYAVIQPSLFEGWNTTVEECKAMNKFIFLSKLAVHVEQTEKYDNVCFFDPLNENDLADKLLTEIPHESIYDYSDCIRRFGEDFYQVMTDRLKE